MCCELTLAVQCCNYATLSWTPMSIPRIIIQLRSIRGGRRTDRENLKQSHKTLSLFVRPLKIPNELPYDITRFSVVRSG
jgi:hypothetical protein